MRLAEYDDVLSSDTSRPVLVEMNVRVLLGEGRDRVWWLATAISVIDNFDSRMNGVITTSRVLIRSSEMQIDGKVM